MYLDLFCEHVLSVRFKVLTSLADYIYALNNDAGRSLMGGRQENWFYQSLIESKTRGATWRIIGSQIVFSRINVTNWFGTCKYSCPQRKGCRRLRPMPLFYAELLAPSGRSLEYSNMLSNDILATAHLVLNKSSLGTH
jgi:hypothetical protein